MIWNYSTDIQERNISFDLINKDDDSLIFSLSYSKEKGSDLRRGDKRFFWMIPDAPSWDDIFFLELRVMAKRNNSGEDLAMLGLTKWDIFRIISKTNGEMFGDCFKMINLKGFE